MIIHEVEQGTDDWFLLRAGKPTASRFKSLVTSSGKESKSMVLYAQELAGEMYAGHQLDTWNGNSYTDYGKETEAEARAAYEMRTGLTVKETGFITDDMGLWGCSPDGLIDDDGMIEIKCLPKNHIPALLYWKKNGKPPPDYIAQVQGQLFIAERQWCDLTFYRPELPMLIVRLKRDESFISGLRDQLVACIAERNNVLEILKEF